MSTSVVCMFKSRGKALLSLGISFPARSRGVGGLGKSPQVWKFFCCGIDVVCIYVFFLFWCEMATGYIHRGRHRLEKRWSYGIDGCLM